MIQYVFTPEAQELLKNGVLRHMVDASGRLMAVLVNTETGKVFEIARGVTASTPQFVVAPFNAVLQLAGLVQNHFGFQETYRRVDQGFQTTYQMLSQVQNSVGVLQATTGLIGVGTVAGVVLSAANLYQTLKLRDEVRQMHLEIKDGFIDLKQVFANAHQDVLERIAYVAADVEFRYHRTILTMAYGDFIQSLDRLRHGLRLPDDDSRRLAINGAQGTLFSSLAAYNSPEILHLNNAPGLLRRRECAWGIDQTITLTYQLQGAYDVVSERLDKLHSRVERDMLEVVDRCNSEEELEFIFPELIRINEQDLTALKLWKSQVDWFRDLSPYEQKDLFDAVAKTSGSPEKVAIQEIPIDVEPAEQILYQSLRPRSHYQALKDILKFKLKPELRQKYQTFIEQNAPAKGLNALVPANWLEVSDLVVANLYWYLQKAYLPSSEINNNEATEQSKINHELK